MLGVVGALAAVGLGFTLSQAWRAPSPPERMEIALPRIASVPPKAVAQPAPKPEMARPEVKPEAKVAKTKPVAVKTARPVDGRARIAIVIDDLGADLKGTARAMALPKSVTLAFLPYPARTPELSHEAFCAGHEIILHMPMEPKSRKHIDGMALALDLPPEEVRRRVEWGLSRVPDRIGLNNHEGSWFTSDHKALNPVMEVLAREKLFFLDSRTTAHSRGLKLARKHGVPAAGRDVFLDNVVESRAIARQLGEVEDLARRTGLAIAIGHPHRQTLAALEAWIPEVEKQGFVLVPLSEAVAQRQ